MAKCKMCPRTSIIPGLRGWIKSPTGDWFCTAICSAANLRNERVARQARRGMHEATPRALVKGIKDTSEAVDDDDWSRSYPRTLAQPSSNGFDPFNQHSGHSHSHHHDSSGSGGCSSNDSGSSSSGDSGSSCGGGD